MGSRPIPNGMNILQQQQQFLMENVAHTQPTVFDNPVANELEGMKVKRDKEKSLAFCFEECGEKKKMKQRNLCFKKKKKIFQKKKGVDEWKQEKEKGLQRARVLFFFGSNIMSGLENFLLFFVREKIAPKRVSFVECFFFFCSFLTLFFWKKPTKPTKFFVSQCRKDKKNNTQENRPICEQ